VSCLLSRTLPSQTINPPFPPVQMTSIFYFCDFCFLFFVARLELRPHITLVFFLSSSLCPFFLSSIFVSRSFEYFALHSLPFYCPCTCFLSGSWFDLSFFFSVLSSVLPVFFFSLCLFLTSPSPSDVFGCMWGLSCMAIRPSPSFTLSPLFCPSFFLPDRAPCFFRCH